MEPNSQTTRRGRIRWLWAFAVVAVLGMAAVTRWLMKPLPPPVVSLSLIGFKAYPTNAYAIMSLSNLGPTKIYYDGQSWEAEFETSDGVLTNRGTHMSVIALSTGMLSNATFAVEVPANATNWRVTSYYTFYQRRNPRLDVFEWLLHSGSPRAFEVLQPAIKLLPMPIDDIGQITTPWLTNLPPAAILSEWPTVRGDAHPF